MISKSRPATRARTGEPPCPEVARIAGTPLTSTLHPPHRARFLPRGEPCCSPRPSGAPDVASDVGWILDTRRPSPEAGLDRTHRDALGGWRGLQPGPGVIHVLLGSPLRHGFCLCMPSVKSMHSPSGSDHRGPPDSAGCATSRTWPNSTNRAGTRAQRLGTRAGPIPDRTSLYQSSGRVPYPSVGCFWSRRDGPLFLRFERRKPGLSSGAMAGSGIGGGARESGNVRQ